MLDEAQKWEDFQLLMLLLQAWPPMMKDEVKRENSLRSGQNALRVRMWIGVRSLGTPALQHHKKAKQGERDNKNNISKKIYISLEKCFKIRAVLRWQKYFLFWGSNLPLAQTSL
ncbi:hypothetical protein ILYODFUR_027048 [Ilyodon furcidens]|uniref:Uncharacterized protein n=1 Tax=Ilyodon furcidens TaxID=33524 RepID=A0ABV0VHI8_9TELE